MTTVTKTKTKPLQQKIQPVTKKTKAQTTPATSKSKATTDETFEVLLEGKAAKLSPKSEGHITYQLIKDSKGIVCLKLLKNTSGGNFSKAPIPLKAVVEILNKQGDRSFKSSIMKEVFTGKGSGSANNTSFLVAVLRSKEVGLITASDKSQFLSVRVTDFKIKAKALFK